MRPRAKKSDNPKGLKSSFTYYIPSPPSRKTGYREKEFDKILTGILQSGFEIESLHTEAVNEGFFVIALLRAPTKKTADLDVGQDIQENFALPSTFPSPDIFVEEEDEA